MSTWLITGGTRGIGRAVLEQATARGDTVVSLARSPSHEPYTHPERILEVKADITDTTSVQDAMEEIQKSIGPIHIVVNSAGVHHGGRIEALDRSTWDEVLNTNLTGAFEVCRNAMPLLGAGSAIVNVGAVVGFRGFSGDVAYGSSKAGLSGMTQVLAVELAPRGIRVNLVVPGFVNTDMTAGLSQRARSQLLETIPTGRVGTAEEIAQVIRSVAESTYMTGAIVPVDGGLLASLSGDAQ